MMASNFSENETSATQSKTTEPLGWEHCVTFNFVVWGLICGAICIFGFIGNTLSIIAFRRGKVSPATTLLQCLAVSDFMLLLSVFVTDSIPYICDYGGTCTNPWSSWPYIRYIWMLTPISHMLSIWFVVLIALNRFWAACVPRDLNRVWNNFTTPIWITAVVVLVVAFNLPRFFEYKIIDVIDSQNQTVQKATRTQLGLSSSYKTYKSTVVNIILIFIPLIALMFISAAIVYTLRRSHNRLGLTNSFRMVDQNAKKKNRNSNASSKLQGLRGRLSRSVSQRLTPNNITLMLFSVVVIAIVCQTPLSVFHFVRFKYWINCRDNLFYLENISKLLVNVNSSINFVIYCLCSNRFRRALLDSLQGCKMTDKSGSESSTSGGRGSHL